MLLLISIQLNPINFQLSIQLCQLILIHGFRDFKSYNYNWPNRIWLTGNVLPVANGPVQSNRKIQLVPVKPVEI